MPGGRGGGGEGGEAQILETLRWFFSYPSRTQPVGVNSLQLQVIMLRGRKAFSPLNTPKTNAWSGLKSPPTEPIEEYFPFPLP